MFQRERDVVLCFRSPSEFDGTKGELEVTVCDQTTGPSQPLATRVHRESPHTPTNQATVHWIGVTRPVDRMESSGVVPQRQRAGRHQSKSTLRQSKGFAPTVLTRSDPTQSRE